MRNFLLVLVLTTLPVLADSDDWQRVRSLPTGARVTVVQSDMKTLRGSLDATSDDAVVVDGTTILKLRVVRISMHKSTRRITNAVVFGLLGGLAGAGAGRFGIACAETNDGCRNALLFAVGGAAGGAAIGALALPDTVEVYRIRRK